METRWIRRAGPGVAAIGALAVDRFDHGWCAIADLGSTGLPGSGGRRLGADRRVVPARPGDRGRCLLGAAH